MSDSIHPFEEFSFSREFPHRWYYTPTATKKAIRQEIRDVLTMLNPETRLNGFRFQPPIPNQVFDLPPKISEFQGVAEAPAQPKTEYRLIKQLNEQSKTPEPLPKQAETTHVTLENPYSHDIEMIKRQIIDDIRQQIATDIKDGLLQWLDDQVEKQVNQKLQHLL